MWKIPAPILCLAALPLLGCAGNYTAPQTAAVTPPPVAASAPYYYASAAPEVYTTGPAAPAAILVFLPGAGSVASEPGLWEAQGFDVVVTPQAADLYRLVADEQAAMARLIASAEAMANAPIWLVGPSQVIETAIPETGGRVSGVIVTSETTPTFSCSESFSYYNPGTGAPPQVKVSRSGNCDLGMPGVTAGQPSVVAPVPAPRSNTPPLIETRSKVPPHGAPRPRIIEASAAGKNLPPAAQVRRLAQLIRSAPPS